MKKLQFSTALVVSFALVACTSMISEGVEDDGTISGKVVFPDPADATLPDGIFPTLENLAKIAPGSSRDDLFYLIGHPHFHEMNGAREWDYVMKFRQADDSVKVCQYKVIYDKNDKAQSFFWKPEDCLGNKVNFSADALFDFNRGSLSDIKAEGRGKLDALAKEIVENGNVAKLSVTGYTDHLGDSTHNLKLSQQRASSVGQYLVDKGVAAENITTKGAGESNPKVTCEEVGDHKKLVDCLAPNRRVEIETW